MEKDSGNPFAEFGSAKQSSSSKSNEESSEGSEKKKSKSIFKWSKKDKDAKKDKVTVAKVEGDADDSQSQTLSEEVVKTRTGNRSMSEASSVVAANARARLLQDPLNKERSNSATRSSIVISPRQASIGPRLATWNQTPSSQSEEGNPKWTVTSSTNMNRSRSGSLVSGHRATSPRQDAATKPSHSRNVSLDQAKGALTSASMTQSPWMNTRSGKSSVTNMVSPNVVKDTDPTVTKLRESVKQLVNNPPSSPPPSRAKITIQENMFLSRGMPTVTIETGDQKNEKASTTFQSDPSLAALLPFPNLDHAPHNTTAAMNATKLASAVVNTLLPEEPSLLETILAPHRQNAQVAQQVENITSIVLDTALKLEEKKEDFSLQGIFDAIDDKYKNNDDNDMSDSLEQEINDAAVWMATDDDHQTTVFISESSDSETSPPTFAHLRNLKNVVSVSMPTLPEISIEELKLQRSNSTDNIRLSPTKTVGNVQPQAPSNSQNLMEPQPTRNRPSVARRLSNAGVMPPLPLDGLMEDDPAFASLPAEDRAEAIRVLKQEEQAKPPLLKSQEVPFHQKRKAYPIQQDVLLLRFQRLAELIQNVHKSSQLRDKKTNEYIVGILGPIEKLIQDSALREKKYIHTHHQFVELLKAVSTSLLSIQGPQQSLKTIFERSSSQNHSMFQAMLEVLQNVLQSVSSYQEELKVVRSVANKQAVDHARMVQTFEQHMSKYDEVVKATKSKYKSREEELKKKLKDMESELVKQRTINRGLLEVFQSKNQQVTLTIEDVEDDPPLKRLPSPSKTNGHTRKK